MYLGNKKQKAMFAIVSSSDTYFVFVRPVYTRSIGQKSKNARPKNGRDKGCSGLKLALLNR